MFDDSQFTISPKNTAEFFPADMGPVESTMFIERSILRQESIDASDKVAKMREVEATDISRLAGEVVRGFGHNKFNLMESAGVVVPDIDRNSLRDNESLSIPEGDIRNFVQGDHLKYVEAITSEADEQEFTIRDQSEVDEKNAVSDNVRSLDDYRQAVDEQFALAG